MRNLLGFPLIIIAAMLQVAFLPHLTAFNLIPNLLLVILVIWGFLRPPEQSIIWAIMAGITLDLFSASTFGIYTLLFVIITFAVSFVKQNFISDISFPFKIFVAFSAFLVFNLLYFLLQQFLGILHIESISFVASDFLFKITPLEILYELVIFILILFPLQKFNEWVSHYEFTAKVPTQIKR